MAAQQAQKVLITAGAGGIGRAVAAAFAATGAQVHVCDLDPQALDHLRAQMPGVTTRVCDIGDRASVQAMMQQATDAMGGLDVLVNNAGIAGPTASVADMDPAAWDAVLRVNLTGTFRVTQFAIPHLKKSSAGSIVVMSSLAGRFGYPNRSPYSTPKWGLIGFTKTLSRELGEFGRRQCPVAWRRRRSALAAGVPGPGGSLGPHGGTGAGGCAGQPVDQAFRRSRRHRGADRLPGVRRRTIDFRPVAADRRRFSKRCLTAGRSSSQGDM